MSDVERVFGQFSCFPHEKNLVQIRRCNGRDASSLTRLKRGAVRRCPYRCVQSLIQWAVDLISQAYALADRGGDKFSGEVIRTLLTEAAEMRLTPV